MGYIIYVNPNFLCQDSDYYHSIFAQNKNMRTKSAAKNGEI